MKIELKAIKTLLEQLFGLNKIRNLFKVVYMVYGTSIDIMVDFNINKILSPV